MEEDEGDLEVLDAVRALADHAQGAGRVGDGVVIGLQPGAEVMPRRRVRLSQPSVVLCVQNVPASVLQSCKYHCIN